MPYYAAKTDTEKHIFESWNDCEKFVKGRKNVVYKKFISLEDAKFFLNRKKLKQQHIRVNLPMAYVDGSYNSETGEYSFGCVLIINKKELNFSKKYSPDEFSNSRNVAGEIKGAGFIIQYAIKMGVKELDLYYDYEGIEKWYTNVWKANSLIAKKYTEFRDKISADIKINFHKVKSHSNDKYNDMADNLAKKALGLI